MNLDVNCECFPEYSSPECEVLLMQISSAILGGSGTDIDDWGVDPNPLS